MQCWSLLQISGTFSARRLWPPNGEISMIPAPWLILTAPFTVASVEGIKSLIHSLERTDCIVYVLDDVPEPLRITKSVAIEISWWLRHHCRTFPETALAFPNLAQHALIQVLKPSFLCSCPRHLTGSISSNIISISSKHAPTLPKHISLFSCSHAWTAVIASQTVGFPLLLFSPNRFYIGSKSPHWPLWIRHLIIIFLSWKCSTALSSCLGQKLAFRVWNGALALSTLSLMCYPSCFPHCASATVAAFLVPGHAKFIVLELSSLLVLL